MKIDKPIDIVVAKCGAFRAIYVNGKLEDTFSGRPYKAVDMARVIRKTRGGFLREFSESYISEVWYEKTANIPEDIGDVEFEADLGTEAHYDRFSLEAANDIKRHIQEGRRMDAYFSDAEAYRIAEYTLGLIDEPHVIFIYDTSS